MLTAILNVKNEARVIARCLESVAPHVDHIIVNDTGSTDDTPAIVAATVAARNKPLTLLQTEWTGYQPARQLLIDTARALDPDGYVLHLDADEELDVGDDDEAIFCLDQPGYMLPVMLNDFEVWQTRIMRLSDPWEMTGALHEIPLLNGANASHRLWWTIINHNDGAQGGAPMEDVRARYARDADHFAQLLADNPTDSRAAYYRAQSLMDSGQHGAAYIAFGVRGAMRHGFDEERYLSLLKVAQYRLAWGWPSGPVVSAFRCAIESRLGRWEARCQLAEYLLRQGLDGEVSSVISGEYPIPSCDLFLVHRPSETWLPILLSLLGDGNIPAAQHILDNAPRVNAHYRQQLQELIDHVVHR